MLGTIIDGVPVYSFPVKKRATTPVLMNPGTDLSVFEISFIFLRHDFIGAISFENPVFHTH